MRGSPICGDEPLNPCESASAYRFNTTHAESCTFTQKNTTRKQRNFSSISAGKQRGSGTEREEKRRSARNGHGEEWGHHRREDATLMKVCLNVCFLPEAERLWELFQADGAVRSSTTSTCCSLPTFVYSHSVQNWTDLLSYIFHGWNPTLG